MDISAQQGFIVSERFAEANQERLSMLQSNPAARTIFTQNGQPFNPGTRIPQRDLGKTLRAIAQNPKRFYTGDIATTIAKDMQRNGGLITLADLKAYRPTWRSPVCRAFKTLQVCSMPPPSSGGVHLIELLNLWSNTKLETQPWHSPDSLHFMAEAMKIAYADRAVHLGDPGFVKVPVTALISPAYAALRFREISMDRARSAQEVKAASPASLQQFRSCAKEVWDK